MHHQAKGEEKKQVQKKYTVRPPKDLRSKFELKQQQRKEKQLADEEEKARKEAEQKQLVGTRGSHSL